ncbi:MAG: IS1 family transposase [Anaerolineaceae bacterium]|nr:IS1 family transposase [Anaerolineaceae bacterium]
MVLCRRTRQIVAFVIGNRSAKTCRKLWQRIPIAYHHCCTFSDLWHANQQVITTGKHASVGKESGETAHVERWNNTLRQRIGRHVRKSFGKDAPLAANSPAAPNVHPCLRHPPSALAWRNKALPQHRSPYD